jgi:hypothetical protein
LEACLGSVSNAEARHEDPSPDERYHFEKTHRFTSMFEHKTSQANMRSIIALAFTRSRAAMI